MKTGNRDQGIGNRKTSNSNSKSQKSGDRMLMKYVRSFLQVSLATLREIFDENAYQRFLVRTGSAASSESYQAFMQEREVSAANRPRCC